MKIFLENSIRKKSEKRACVALLLRPEVLNSYNTVENIQPKDIFEFEAFFILRAKNPGDRWSGHVAFPGGRQEEKDGNDDLKTCIREVEEEVNIRIEEEFNLLGSLDDLQVIQGESPLSVRCFIFLEKENSTRNYQKYIELAQGEVAACGFTSISKFLDHDRFYRFQHPHVPGVEFGGFTLEMNSLWTATNVSGDQIVDKFVLWGLTFTLWRQLFVEKLHLINDFFIAPERIGPKL
eukprot:snap_masked-scaffold_3-processed-gene-3.22-mRNA-1 protein AED:0.01 eAED:0.01 QI:522/1/0.8/1/0.75/0.6/5/128/235